MRIIGSIISTATAFVITALILGVMPESDSFWGNLALASLVFVGITSLTSIVTLLIGGFAGGLLGAFVDEAKTGATCGVIVAIPVSVLIEVIVAMNMHDWLDFFPQLTFWEAALFVGIATVFSLLFNSSRKS